MDYRADCVMQANRTKSLSMLDILHYLYIMKMIFIFNP
jgi:hypothetical protein